MSAWYSASRVSSELSDTSDVWIRAVLPEISKIAECQHPAGLSASSVKTKKPVSPARRSAWGIFRKGFFADLLAPLRRSRCSSSIHVGRWPCGGRKDCGIAAFKVLHGHLRRFLRAFHEHELAVAVHRCCCCCCCSPVLLLLLLLLFTAVSAAAAAAPLTRSRFLVL